MMIARETDNPIVYFGYQKLTFVKAIYIGLPRMKPQFGAMLIGYIFNIIYLQ